MRQHITAEQLQELDPEQVKKLYEYTRAHIWGTDDFKPEMITVPHSAGTAVYQLSLLSIGQCIEFLHEKDFAKLQKTLLDMYAPMFVCNTSDTKLVDEFKAKLVRNAPLQIVSIQYDEEPTVVCVQTELIDVLWGVVKDIL